MSSSSEEVKRQFSSDKMHNKNCFNYLRNLKIPSRILAGFPDELKDLATLQNQTKDDYDSNYPYGDLYTRFFDYIDDTEIINEIYKSVLPEIKNKIESELDLAKEQLKQQESIKTKIPEEQKLLSKLFRNQLIEQIERLENEKENIDKQVDQFFVSIYSNDNHILKDTYSIIKDITLKKTPISSSVKSSIAEHTKDTGTLINTKSQTPAQAESNIGRVTAVFSGDYKPQHKTSLSTVREYEYNKSGSVKELRFGTQGQRHNGEERVSPLFEQFLRAQVKQLSTKSKDKIVVEPTITHIYFNNLGRDRTDFEGKKERALSLKLEELEERHHNIAVITLPADKGLMHHHDYQKTTPIHSYDDVREEFLHIASEDGKCDKKIKDFHISPKIRKRLFKDEASELGDLIDNSFKALGIQKKTNLSDAQKQAVWFHFIKFELTNHIIDLLNPQSINFSCKDAIDRGGVSSVYYNLLKSFDQKSSNPMSREEFEQGLHAAPTMVKGRGMNDHINILWNTVDLYVEKNYEELNKSPERSWLIEWRDLNCPHARVEELLSRRLPQIEKELSESKSPIAQLGTEIIQQISKQIDCGVSGKRLLLEAAIRTRSIILEPFVEDINQRKETLKNYSELSDALSINYPKLIIVAGLMKSLVGIVVYAFSKETGSNLMKEGLATFKAGYNVDDRRILQSQMKTQLANIIELEKIKTIDQNKIK